MIGITEELRAKLLAAKSEEEAAGLLSGAGIDAAQAERIRNELKNRREADGRGCLLKSWKLSAEEQTGTGTHRAAPRQWSPAAGAARTTAAPYGT